MALLFFTLFLLATGAQAAGPTIGGVWTLNRSASDVPKEIGFNADWLQQAAGAAGDSSTPRSSGGGGRRGGRGGGSGSGGTGPYNMPRVSYDDAQRTQFLTGEARNPPTRLTIVDAGTAITLTTELGQSRTLHVTGKDEAIEVGGVTLIETTKRDADAVVVTYTINKDRQVRYTLTPSAKPAQLVVEVQFLDHGSGDKAKLVYDAGAPTETGDVGGAPGGGLPAGGGVPASRPAESTPAGTDLRPGAELRGLKAVGILVEDFGPQAQSCGLNHDAVESTLSKKLTDAGFVVQRNSDEDTYLYVNVQTSTVNGVCVSRYDAFLYTQGTATLSYKQQPALVQVSLIHRGGIGSSAPSGHASAVTRALEGYVDIMLTSIRDANK
jgi:hypothetical protein